MHCGRPVSGRSQRHPKADLSVITRTSQRLGVFIALTSLLAISLLCLNVQATSPRVREMSLQFSSGHTVLDGTLLLPDLPGPHPAIVLIHGAGPLTRDAYRPEAELFAQSGLAAFIYDKRTEGYSADGVGEESRSYSLLADDVVAAVRMLRSRADIIPNKIGVWGHSEGASVAPLAASRSDDVAFVMVVSLSGVPPIQQTAWALENQLRHVGVSSPSLLHSFTRTWMRFMVSAGLFAEATYDPIPSLAVLSQPVMAVWGNNDRTAPPQESALIFQQTLQQGENRHYAVHFFAGADHSLRASPDGFSGSDDFASGYADALRAWVGRVIQGQPQESNIQGPPPMQDRPSPAGLVSLSWYDSAWLHLTLICVLVCLFSSPYWLRLINRLEKRHGLRRDAPPLPWYAHILAITGIVATVGLYGYLGFVMISTDVGPLIMGRPVPWLVLQLLAATVCGLTAVVARGLWFCETMRCGQLRPVLLAVGGMLFLPWALYWRLLLP